jgi:uncharacterized NAD(P)/FAD-binding protein YdhS
MMTAVHLLSSAQPLKVIVINSRHPFGRGIAYSPYSPSHLLNVAAGKMSAFTDRPDHFVEWIRSHTHFEGLSDTNLIGGSYMPRQLYGDYLQDVWSDAMASRPRHVEVELVDGFADQIDHINGAYRVHCNGRVFHAQRVVLATGNSLPARPSGLNAGVAASPMYHGDPWSVSSIQTTSGNNGDVLIVGNGLTMVDTVVGLIEQGFGGTIYSLSPNGFSILSHRHTGPPYQGIQGDIAGLHDNFRLLDVVRLFRKHVRLVRKLGLSAEPVVDALRPWTQKIWRKLSTAERSRFLARLRHLWGVARHRLPLHVHDRIQNLRIDGRLKVIAGKITAATLESGGVSVEFFNRRARQKQRITVGSVINCTGPAGDVLETDNDLLKNLLSHGLLTHDKLHLGIEVDPDTFEVINQRGSKQEGMYAMGNIVKGVLWETTAVPELRVQAHTVARNVLSSVLTESTVSS